MHCEEEEDQYSDDGSDQEIRQAIPSIVNSIIDMMLKQSQTVLYIVIVHAILNTLFTTLGLYFRQDTQNKLYTLLDDMERAVQLYWFLTIVDIGSCAIFYYLTIKAYMTKSYLYHSMLLKWVYLCFFIQVFLAYINKYTHYYQRLNILLVLLKILTYIYSKFVAQLIKGIVGLPRQRLD